MAARQAQAALAAAAQVLLITPLQPQERPTLAAVAAAAVTRQATAVQAVTAGRESLS